MLDKLSGQIDLRLTFSGVGDWINRKNAVTYGELPNINKIRKITNPIPAPIATRKPILRRSIRFLLLAGTNPERPYIARARPNKNGSEVLNEDK